MKEVRIILDIKISVVIIGKNEEDNILRNINSIKNTVEYKKSETEILYIDSGSEDNTIFNIISNHNDIKVYRIEDDEVKTASKGRHLGALLCKGEYILFLDADMELHNLFLSRILDVSKTDPGFIGGIGIRNDIFLNNGIEVYRKQNVYNTLSEKKCNHFGGALFIKREFLIGIGNYGSSIIANEEAELDSRIIQKGKFIKEYPFQMINHYIRIEDDKKSLKNILFGKRNQGIGQGFRHSFYFKSTFSFIKRFNLFFIAFFGDLISLTLILTSVINYSLFFIAILIQMSLSIFYMKNRKLKFFVLHKIYALHFFKGVLNCKLGNKINFVRIDNYKY